MTEFIPMMVYIASPYTKGDNFINVQRQIECSNKLMDAHLVPFAPLVNSCFVNMQHFRSYDEWLPRDFFYISKCDALLRLEGESFGADKEVAEAKRLGIPVFYSIESLLEYVQSLHVDILV